MKAQKIFCQILVFTTVMSNLPNFLPAKFSRYTVSKIIPLGSSKGGVRLLKGLSQCKLRANTGLNHSCQQQLVDIEGGSMA